MFKNIIPEKYHLRIRYIYSLFYLGKRHTCPCCGGNFRKFIGFSKEQPDAICPRCGSFERHRLLWLYLKEKTDFFRTPLKVLDIAPLRFLQKKYQAFSNLDYLSVDLSSSWAMMMVDLTKTPFSENHFDCILCYHVLEHIPDDQKAMKELYRILKPGGWGILQTPVDIKRGQTFECPEVPALEREKVFGHPDHVRIYGRDYFKRLEKAGFIVKTDNYASMLGDTLIQKYSLMKDEEIYVCLKPK